MQKIIQSHACLLKLSRKQESVMHVACYYHYLGWIITWKYLKQGFWGKILVFG
jgi:hypothetical protein